MQLTFFFDAEDEAAAACRSLKKPGRDRPRVDRPPTRINCRRDKPVQSELAPVKRSSIATNPHKAGVGWWEGDVTSPVATSLTHFPALSTENSAPNTSGGVH